MAHLTDIEIARAATLKPIEDIGARLGIPPESLYRYGPFKAKLAAELVETARQAKRGRLILVTAISPTPAGEGKTTTTIGLGDALARIGKKAAICLREPSLGPCFGAKGGATGGGKAQVAPMEEINLHFTGDLHAIGAASNLLAAMIDNHLYWGNELDIDPRRISWRRFVDLNDRALRQVVIGLGDSVVREAAFDITVASETMAVFCLARSLKELEERLGRMVVAETRLRRDASGKPIGRRAITAGDLGAAGATTALLKDAFRPNLAQTLEHTPAIIHGGPFANIAHGCNSLVATETALGLADWVVTEAGFGADLGAEKFVDIKCRLGGLKPEAAVLVATLRALKMHGGVAKADLAQENVEALQRGAANLARHIANLRQLGLPVLVALNEFTGDSAAELDALRAICAEAKAELHLCRHWAEGGAGAEELAHAVVRAAEANTAPLTFLYPDEMGLADKIDAVAVKFYGAAGIDLDTAAAKRIRELEAQGHGRLPVCIAKTQYSFSADAAALGAPSGHRLPVREVRLSAGAGFVVALCGDIRTMPGLPRRPAALEIGLDESGDIVGLS